MRRRRPGYGGREACRAGGPRSPTTGHTAAPYALSTETHLSGGGEAQHGETHVDGYLRPGTSVVEEPEQSRVPTTGGMHSIRGIEQVLDLGALQTRDGRICAALEGDLEHLAREGRADGLLRYHGARVAYSGATRRGSCIQFDRFEVSRSIRARISNCAWQLTSQSFESGAAPQPSTWRRMFSS